MRNTKQKQPADIISSNKQNTCKGAKKEMGKSKKILTDTEIDSMTKRLQNMLIRRNNSN